MSQAEDEAKARLEVAQLYEEMGQTAKAVRYLLNAAEVFKEAGITNRAREIFQKILTLDPSNAQAQAELNAILGAGGGAPAPPPTPRPAPVPGQPSGETTAAPAAAAPPQYMAPPGAGPNGLLVPTPWVGRDPRYIQAARQQLTAAPDKFKFPHDPLPKVDQRKVQERAEARRKMDEEAARKARPNVESSFSDRKTSVFARPSGEQQPAAGGPVRPAASAGGGGFGTASGFGRASGPAAPAAPQTPGRFSGGAGTGAGDIRGGNRDLADQIAKRLQERKK